jgi:hypothetical protein
VSLRRSLHYGAFGILQLGCEQQRAACRSGMTDPLLAICSGAQKNQGLEGETSLYCCDARVSVLKVWSVLDHFLLASHGTTRASATPCSAVAELSTHESYRAALLHVRSTHARETRAPFYRLPCQSAPASGPQKLHKQSSKLVTSTSELSRTILRRYPTAASAGAPAMPELPAASAHLQHHHDPVIRGCEEGAAAHQHRGTRRA